MIFEEDEVSFDELSEESLKGINGGITFPVPSPSDPERGSPLDDEKEISWSLDNGEGWTNEPPLPTKPGTYRLYGN